MRNDDTHDADNLDKVVRMRVHVGLEGNYMDQIIVVQIRCAIATQAAESPLVEMTRGRDVEGHSRKTYRAGLHRASPTGESE